VRSEAVRCARRKLFCTHSAQSESAAGRSSSSLGGELKTSAFIWCALAGTSCAVVDHDVTNEPVAANLFGKCFVTQQTLYLVNTSSGFSVPDQLSTSDGGGICRNPSALGGLIKCGFTLKGAVPSGTEIIVTRVTDKAVGESGRCWSVQGRFKDAHLKQSDFDIPSCNFKSFSKTWLNEWMPADTYRSGAKLEFKTDVLRSCDSSSAP
jgi:hypothetical protein